MPLSSNAVATYSARVIREDLQEAIVSIAPTETPFFSAIGRGRARNTYVEWPVVSLAAVNSSNAVLEGENAPSNDAPTLANRFGNYTQISDKVVEVTDTADAVDGAGNDQTLATQVARKLLELRRDMEAMLLSNTPANAGSNTVARRSAGLPAFLRTNVNRGTGGANPTLSGTTNGYPNAGATDGTLRALTETRVNDVITACWEAGATPSIIMVSGGAKRKISASFTGSNDRQINIAGRRIVASVDFYVSDFGELSVVPNRFQRSRDVFIIDPSYARVKFLNQTRKINLARTGHAERMLITAEWTLQVDTEAAHGIVADIDPSL